MVKLADIVITTTSIDTRLVGKVFTGANTIIPDRIKKLFTLTCFGVAEQLEEERMIDKPRTSVNCMFTDYGKITLELDEDQFGNVIGLIIFPIKKWSDHNLSDLHIILCMAEELCHYLWGIEDEVEVNYKVLPIIRSIFPEKILKWETCTILNG